MENKKKKFITISIVVFLIILLPIIVFISYKTYMKTDAGKIAFIENRYKIKFTENISLSYKFESEQSFSGDSVKYYVLKFDNAPAVISLFKSNNLKDYEDPNEGKTAVVDYFNTATSKNWHPNIPLEYLPDWNKEYSWNDGSKLNGMMAIYDHEKNYLICSIVKL